MKKNIALFLFFFVAIVATKAQQRLAPKQMSFVASQKPNSIFYRDTLYKGSKEFKYLFYRTLDRDLMGLYERHQSNKICGNIFTTIGTIATTVGVITLTDKNNNSTSGWILIGGGIASSITGGYLLLQGQRNLMRAVILFNERYAKTQVGIGVSNQQAGLVINF